MEFEKMSPNKQVSHRFLDEMGDSTFFGKGGVMNIGQQGVSLTFGMGIARIDRDLDVVRDEIRALQRQIETDPLYNAIPSVQKRVKKEGFFFHASHDSPEVRAVFLHYLKDLPCTSEHVVARKIPDLFVRKHHGNDSEFFADILSHLIKSRLKKNHRLVLNIASRGSSTRSRNLDVALEKATTRAQRKWGADQLQGDAVFNVQSPISEPLLCIPDYLNWAVQRVFEKGETRFYTYLLDKIRLVVDLYDFESYTGSKNYYDHKRNPLTPENKLGPPTT
ncbi:MAG: hypothetical protein WD490_10660 [Opitutales bacterium]